MRGGNQILENLRNPENSKIMFTAKGSFVCDICSAVSSTTLDGSHYQRSQKGCHVLTIVNKSNCKKKQQPQEIGSIFNVKMLQLFWLIAITRNHKKMAVMALPLKIENCNKNWPSLNLGQFSILIVVSHLRCQPLLEITVL